PRPHSAAAGFVPWIDLIRRERRTDENGIAASVREGAELALAGGTVAVGDIAGAPGGRPALVPWRQMARSGVIGVWCAGFFGIGGGEEPARGRVAALLEEIEEEATGFEQRGVRLGLQPHAPNTVSLASFRWAQELALARGLPLATHLAETPE